MNKRWWSRNTGVPPGVRRLAPKFKFMNKTLISTFPLLQVSMAGFTLSSVGEFSRNVCSESILASLQL